MGLPIGTGGCGLSAAVSRVGERKVDRSCQGCVLGTGRLRSGRAGAGGALVLGHDRLPLAPLLAQAPGKSTRALGRPAAADLGLPEEPERKGGSGRSCRLLSGAHVVRKLR